MILNDKSPFNRPDIWAKEFDISKTHRHKWVEWIKLWSGNYGRFCMVDGCLEEQIMKVAKEK